MPTYKIGEPTQQQFIDDNGDPATGHVLYFYTAGTTTPAAIAFDPAGAATATSVTIGSNGFPQNSGSDVTIYYDDAITYDIVRKDSGGVAYGATIEDFSVASVTAGVTSGVLSAGGSAANVITADLSPSPGSLSDQQQVVVELQHGANTTTTPTFNLNSLGAKTIVRASSQPLRIGDTGGSGYKLFLSYSSTLDNWVLLNPALEPVKGIDNAVGSAADVITATYTPVQGALSDGFEIIVELDHAANATTTPTFNLNSIGAKTIVKGANEALAIGDTMGSGAKLHLCYSD